MPKPKPGQSRDDFLRDCIPEVLEEGTAENQAQAIAICISMYENK